MPVVKRSNSTLCDTCVYSYVGSTPPACVEVLQYVLACTIAHSLDPLRQRAHRHACTDKRSACARSLYSVYIARRVRAGELNIIIAELLTVRSHAQNRACQRWPTCVNILQLSTRWRWVSQCARTRFSLDMLRVSVCVCVCVCGDLIWPQITIILK